MRLSIYFFTVLLSASLYSQQGLPIYTDYLTDNYYLIHPSMAGATDCSQVRITGRQNWTGVEDAPGLFTAAYNSKINASSAIGANAFTDTNGFTSQNGAYITYAHHINLSNNNQLKRLSFGISPGLLQYSLDRSTFGSVIDPINNNENDTDRVEFNLDLGVSFHVNDLYLIATLKNALENRGFNVNAREASNLRNLLLSIGYTYKFKNNPIGIEPSILYSNRLGIDQAFTDLNAKVYYDFPRGKIWGGLSYRLGLDEQVIENPIDSIINFESLSQWSPFIGINFEKFMVAYNYTAQNNDIIFVSGGFHQVTLGLNFNCLTRKRKGKYNCFCPSVK